MLTTVENSTKTKPKASKNGISDVSLEVIDLINDEDDEELKHDRSLSPRLPPSLKISLHDNSPLQARGETAIKKTVKRSPKSASKAVSKKHRSKTPTDRHRSLSKERTYRNRESSLKKNSRSRSPRNRAKAKPRSRSGSANRSRSRQRSKRSRSHSKSPRRQPAYSNRYNDYYRPYPASFQPSNFYRPHFNFRGGYQRPYSTFVPFYRPPPPPNNFYERSNAPENNVLAVFGLDKRVNEIDLMDVYKAYGCEECKIILDKHVRYK